MYRKLYGSVQLSIALLSFVYGKQSIVIKMLKQYGKPYHWLGTGTVVRPLLENILQASCKALE